MTLTLLVVAWLLTYLVHSTILLGGAWTLSATGIVRSPVVRDALWKVALVGAVLTATVYSMFPYQPFAPHVMLPGAMEAAPPASLPRIERPAAPENPGRAAAAPQRVPAARAAVVSHREVPASQSGPAVSLTPNPQPLTPSWPLLLLGLWALGALTLLVRSLICRHRLLRSLRHRRAVADPRLLGLLDSLRATAGVRRTIRLTVSSELAGPIAVGGSEICLPERALTALSPAEQRAVLAHELGHLVRQDPLWLGLGVACESVLFLQPLNRLARRRIQATAELLCDDWAAHQTGGGLTLARCLAEVATWIEAAPRAAPVSGMAENPSQLVERVHRLLGGVQPAARRVRMAVPVAALALATMAFAAPGVSPPCSADQQGAAARADSGRAPARTLVQGGPQVWATIRDGNVIRFREGFAPKLTGQGHLGIRRGGSEIELGDGQRLLVNGRAPSDEELVQVCEVDTLQIVDGSGRTLWRVEPVRLTPEQAEAWARVGSPQREMSGALASLAEVRAEAAAGLAGRHVDSLESRLEDLSDTLDAFDTADVEAISRAAAELSNHVTRQVSAELAPRIAEIQEMGIRMSSDLVPRMAELGARMAAEIAPAIVESVCSGGDLCDSASVRRHKAVRKHRQ